MSLSNLRHDRHVQRQLGLLRIRHPQDHLDRRRRHVRQEVDSIDARQLCRLFEKSLSRHLP